MNVAGELCRQLEVYNGFDLFDIKATSCEISGGHEIIFLFFEISKSLDSLRLTEVSVKLANSVSKQTHYYSNSVALLFSFEEDYHFLLINIQQN